MKPPDKIYLIRVNENEWAWCDSPDPAGGIDPQDVVEYERSEND